MDIDKIRVCNGCLLHWWSGMVTWSEYFTFKKERWTFYCGLEYVNTVPLIDTASIW